MRLSKDEEPIMAGYCIGHIGEYAVFLTQMGELYVSKIPEEVAELGYIADERTLTRIEDLPEPDRQMVNNYIEAHHMENFNEWEFVFGEDELMESAIPNEGLEERNIEKMERALKAMFVGEPEAEKEVMRLLGERP